MYILEKGVLSFISETLPMSVFEILPTTWEDLRVCGRERLIPVCSVTETGLNIEIFHVAGWHNMGLDVRKPVFGGFRTTKA